MEQHRIEERLLHLGVRLICKKTLLSAVADYISAHCRFSGEDELYEINSIIFVTARNHRSELYF
jgi:hypothetical protein